MKSIFLPLTDPQSDQWAIERAVDVAADLNSHLTVLLIDAVPIMVPAYPHYPAMSHYPLLLQQLEDEASARQARAVSTLQDFADRKGVSTDGGSRAPTAALTRVEGDDWMAVREAAPVHDAILFVRQITDAERPLDTPELMKDTLEYAGRPILVTTGKIHRSLGTHVGIAWNGSVESARAVTAAMPILSRAERVTIFTFATTKTEVGEAERLQSYLSRHEIEATLNTTAPEGAIGEALVAAAEGKGVSLLVTGGYTHSRLRQAILGGVTRHLLERCRIPLLMAH